jgi:hypothetical protein
VKTKLYPVVGLKKKDDHIWANFGQVPFMFDIDGYMKVSSALCGNPLFFRPVFGQMGSLLFLCPNQPYIPVCKQFFCKCKKRPSESRVCIDFDHSIARLATALQ